MCCSIDFSDGVGSEIYSPRVLQSRHWESGEKRIFLYWGTKKEGLWRMWNLLSPQGLAEMVFSCNRVVPSSPSWHILLYQVFLGWGLHECDGQIKKDDKNKSLAPCQSWLWGSKSHLRNHGGRRTLHLWSKVLGCSLWIGWGCLDVFQGQGVLQWIIFGESLEKVLSRGLKIVQWWLEKTDCLLANH